MSAAKSTNHLCTNHLFAPTSVGAGGAFAGVGEGLHQPEVGAKKVGAPEVGAVISQRNQALTSTAPTEPTYFEEVVRGELGMKNRGETAPQSAPNVLKATLAKSVGAVGAGIDWARVHRELPGLTLTRRGRIAATAENLRRVLARPDLTGVHLRFDELTGWRQVAITEPGESPIAGAVRAALKKGTP